MLKCFAVSLRELLSVNSSTLLIRLSLYFLVKAISAGVTFLSVSGVAGLSVLESSVFGQSWLSWLDHSIGANLEILLEILVKEPTRTYIEAV